MAPACDSQVTDATGRGPCPGSTASTRAGPNQPERRLSSGVTAAHGSARAVTSEVVHRVAGL
eukprot:12022232-Alexandrium_andersonii.AAC.1